MLNASLSPARDESFLRLLFEQSPGFMAVMAGPDHRYTLVNPAYQTLIGHRAILGMAVRDALPDLAGQGYFEILDEVFATGRPFVGKRSPARLIRDGDVSMRYVDFVYQPLFESVSGSGGAVVGIFIQGSDVTDQVHAERAALESASRLEEQRRLFDLALSAMSDFAYIIDRDARLVYVNRPLLALWGLASEDAVGKRFSELGYEPALAAKLDREIATVLETGLPLTERTAYTSPTGQSSWYEYIFNPSFDADGQVRYVVGTTRDIGALVRQQEHAADQADSERAARTEAERVSRQKEEFAATVSHELRTPLNAVVGWAQLLVSGQLDRDMTEQAIAKIIRNVHLQSRLISDLLDVSGMVSGKLKLKLERVSLREQLAEAVEATSFEAGSKKIALFLGEIDDVQLNADPVRLQQVVWNLLGNAIKFTPHGGQVFITTDATADHVTLSIRETGPGFDADFAPRLFDRFSQSDSTSTRTHGGLGLGLSIVKTLVELHGGVVKAQCEVGHGAQFDVTLPRAHQAPTSAAPVRSTPGIAAFARRDAPLTLAGVDVLVVDDAEEGRNLVCRILETYGARVTTAASALEVIGLLAGTTPDLLISDIGMPLVDGYQLIRQIRQLPGTNRTLPAIALTAFARPQDAERARDAGFDCHVAKPIEPALLHYACIRTLQGVDCKRVDDVDPAPVVELV